MQWRYARADLARRHAGNPLRSRPFFGHADLPRLREGGVAVVTLGVPVPVADARAGPRIGEQLILAAHAAMARDGRTRLLRPGDDPVDAKRRGRLLAIFGIEGAHVVGFDLDVLPAWRALGVRLVGPAHLVPNIACQPSSRPVRADDPLTAYGRALVEAVDDAGLVLDLAHMNRRGFEESLALHRGRVLVSHTGVTAAHDLWRNVTDDQAKAVADRDGVIGIILYPVFLRGSPFGTIEDVVDHIDAARRVVGSAHVAFGSDFDGGITLPDPLRGASDLPVLTDAMLRRGFTPDECVAILGGNAMRVLAG